MIRVEHLAKSYGAKQVIDDVSFDVQPGEVLGFLGPNGAGKTTTMRILTGYILPTKGSVTIDDIDVQEQSFAVRKKIGYLPENNPLYDSMKVYEYLEFVARAKGVAQQADEVRRVVSSTHLQEKLTAPISELSKGYRQRVGLADALLGNPDILILDEPTSGLDPNQAAEIRTLIRTIGKTKTVIFSTHILNEVQTTCDRVLIIHQGKIVGQGTVDELVRQSKGHTEVRVRIEGSQNAVLSTLQQIAGVQEVLQEKDEEYVLVSRSEHDVCRDVYQACVNNRWTLLRMQTSETSLEDIFRQLTN